MLGSTASKALLAFTRRYSVQAAELRASANRMLDHYVERQLPSGALVGLDDACHYCKLPNALVWGGRIREADAMLDHCVERFFRPNGDFTNQPVASHYAPAQKTLHWEFNDFYAYLNQWWITAGVRLSGNDFIGKAFSYVDTHWYNPKVAAGILQEPLDMRYENCIFTSAHLGFTMLHMGDERATAIGNTIVTMVSKQPHMGAARVYYNRFDDDLNLLTSFEPTDPGVKLAAIIDGNKPGQCWWSLGYPVAFLAHLYQRVGDRRYLEAADTILSFVQEADPEARHSIIAHKVMWGASLMGNITGDPKYWSLVRSIAAHIIHEGQADDGRVLNWGWERGTPYGEAQVVDQTGEIAYWFFVVARQMEKAEQGGRLA